MKENETIEFKKSLAELKAGLVSIAAILNKHGSGELWFGLRNDYMVEAWGRGMPLILKNAPNVKFREIADIFIAAFERPSFMEEKEPPHQEAADITIDKTIDKALSVTEKTILDLIADNPAITQKEMAEKLSLSEIGIRYNTNRLKAKGVLRRVGGKKAGHWKIMG